MSVSGFTMELLPIKTVILGPMLAEGSPGMRQTQMPHRGIFGQVFSQRSQDDAKHTQISREVLHPKEGLRMTSSRGRVVLRVGAPCFSRGRVGLLVRSER